MIRPCRGRPLLYSFEPRPGTEDTCEDTASARDAEDTRAALDARDAPRVVPRPRRSELNNTCRFFFERRRSRYKLAEHCRADRADGGASREEGATRGSTGLYFDSTIDERFETFE